MKIFKVAIALCMVVFSINSCNPVKKVVSVSPVQKADDFTAKSEYERVNEDIETVLRSNYYENNARTEVQESVILPCGKVTLNNSNFTIQYEGKNCYRKVLSGTIDVKLIKGSNFAEKDAKLEITFKDYRVYYSVSNSSITYNGKQYLTNITGGRLADLFTNKADTISFKCRTTGFTLMFDSASIKTATRNWNIARIKTFTSNGTPTGITFTAVGDTTFMFDSISEVKISEWGKNKDNRDFINITEVPFRWENCGIGYQGPYILKQGKIIHKSYAITPYGYFRGTFIAEAGYRFVTNAPIKVNNCDSEGYLLNWILKLNNNVIWSHDDFQPY